MSFSLSFGTAFQIFHKTKKAADFEIRGFAPFSLRRTPELVLEVSQDSFDLSFGTASRESVSAFEQIYEIVAPAVYSIDIIRTEFVPVVIDYISKMFPLCSENILVHYFSYFLAWDSPAPRVISG